MRTASLLLLAVCAACATSGPKPPPEPRSSVDVLLHRSKELHLTPQQREQLQAIEDKRAAKSERLRMDLRLKYEQLTSGDNRNTYANRGSNAGVVELHERVVETRRKLRDLDDGAVHAAEQLLEGDQLDMAHQYVSGWRSRGVGGEEVGED